MTWRWRCSRRVATTATANVPPDLDDPAFQARWNPALAARMAEMAAREPVGVEGARRAIAWAEAAGLTPAGVDEITAIIDGHEGVRRPALLLPVEALGIR